MGSTTLLIILLVVGLDFVIVPLVLVAVVRSNWSPLVAKHPAVPPAADAVGRNFQSYKIGLFNLGYMIHTTVDDLHLHLFPAKFGRMIGMKPVSIPWEEITPLKRRGKKYAEVKIGTNTVLGPRWALELAFADHPSDPNPNDPNPDDPNSESHA